MSRPPDDRAADRVVVVVGTAGHVDHGKSALVRALTGTDPDRLLEEKARGLTIDLGFAWTELGGGVTASFVDVPGHEDFVRNMLAGAGAIDVALLVVAADEGPMPQTLEHLAILELLGIENGVVALTKVDLVDEEWLGLVQDEVESLISGGSLAGAPIVPVSSIRGDGLDALRSTLQRQLATAPRARDRGRPRLSVDRVFTIAGFGTVVTGTLRDGSIRETDVLEVLPAGGRARARGVQMHGRAVDVALPGTRAAINLAGLSPEDLERGNVVAAPGVYRPTRLVDVEIRLLSSAPATLRHDAEVVVFHGAAEVPAYVRVIGGRLIEPGGHSYAQLRFLRATVLSAGDRFVIRQPSPANTIGGGVVLDPHPRSRWRRTRPSTLDRFADLASGNDARVAWRMLAAREPCAETGLEPSETGLDRERLAAALRDLEAEGRAVLLGHLWITGAGWQTLSERLRAALEAYHAANPLRSGAPAEELRERLGLSAEAFAVVADRAQNEGWLVRSGPLLRASAHGVRLDQAQQASADELLRRFRASPFRPPSAKEAESAVGAAVLAHLIERGELVAVGGDVVFDAEAYSALRAGAVEHAKNHGSVTVADLRDRFDTSRKYALALLEHLDRLRVTRRVGDAHALAGTPEARGR